MALINYKITNYGLHEYRLSEIISDKRILRIKWKTVWLARHLKAQFRVVR